MLKMLYTFAMPAILEESVENYMEKTFNNIPEDSDDVPPAAKKLHFNQESQMENFVGNVIHYCNALKLPTPVYEVLTETGQGNDKMYTVVCTLGDEETSGEGRNKRLAKQQAALKMCEILKKLFDASRAKPSASETDTPLNA